MAKKDTDIRHVTYYVDEAGDGILFGAKGRNRLSDHDAARFFILGMVRVDDEDRLGRDFSELRERLMANPLFSSIRSLLPAENKTARFFHAKDDHPEIRVKVFELILNHDFKFFAVIKDMKCVLEYVKSRNQMDSSYKYTPNELYDLTVRMLFKQQLHKHDHYRVVFARRGKSDRTKALLKELHVARQAFLDDKNIATDSTMDVEPAHSWERPGLQLADYCLWALQRCYERGEDRFLKAIWHKVSLIHDVDDPEGKQYGTYLHKKKAPPDVRKIKNRWI